MWMFVNFTQEVQWLSPDFLHISEELALGVAIESTCLVVMGHCPVGLVGNLLGPVFVALLVNLWVSQMLVAFPQILFSVYDNSATALVSLSDDQVLVVMGLLDGSPDIWSDVADVVFTLKIPHPLLHQFQSVLHSFG